jgi:hypothetical protein
MEARIARLESDVAHLRTDVGNIKTDVRSLRDKMDAMVERFDAKFDALKDSIAAAKVWALVLYNSPRGRNVWNDGARLRLDLGCFGSATPKLPNLEPLRAQPRFLG